MTQYVTIGVTDIVAASNFYDVIFSPLNWRRWFGTSKMQFYSDGKDGIIAICLPENGGPMSAGHGTMFGLSAESNEIVGQEHAAALAWGGADEGAPGYRVPAMYIAYFRDLDGNKLAVYHLKSAAAFADYAVKHYGAIGGEAFNR